MPKHTAQAATPGTPDSAPRAIAPAIANALGIALIVAVFALTLPLAVPQMLGYQVFDIISGSMEPAIPIGSAIYVRAVDPAEVQADEVIAFYDRGTVVAHRVVANRTSMGEFITKGDANNTEDLDPIPYDDLIGTVVLSVPYIGAAMALYSSFIGKVYLMLALACGIMLNLLADRMRRQRSREARERLQAQLASDGTASAARVPRSGAGGWVRIVLMAVLALVFFGSGGVIFYVRNQQSKSLEIYEAASSAYTRRLEAEAARISALTPPIEVDFAALTAVNPDVVGWIYCEGTGIDYPVLHGETNDTYLRHEYTGEYNINGSIFIDAENATDFSDANTIVYGHHMSSGAMFAVLESWEEQSFYDEHPVMWLLTPTQNYRVDLVAGRHVSSQGSMYEIMSEHDERFATYLAEAVAESDFAPAEGIVADPRANYLMLTTCAYIFDGARYTLVGQLVPAL